MNDAKSINENLTQFWAKALSLSEQERAELEQEKPDYTFGVPSPELYNAVKDFSSCRHVLDYGCGSGWASLVAAKAGCLDVTACDMDEAILGAVDFYAKLFQAPAIHTAKITSEWLNGIPDEHFDGIVCSNVLDVVPLETGDIILQTLSRLAHQEAKIVIGLNFCLSVDQAKARGMELVEGKYLFVDGVLRLLSLNDEEWTKRFSPYFKVERLEYFAWPGEKTKTRRLFVLTKKYA